jgi:ABC-type nickel/cobalt efflux system permease component RcnA
MAKSTRPWLSKKSFTIISHLAILIFYQLKKKNAPLLSGHKQQNRRVNCSVDKDAGYNHCSFHDIFHGADVDEFLDILFEFTS